MGVVIDHQQAIPQPAEIAHSCTPSDLGLGWRPKHQVHRCPELPPEHEGSRRAVTGLLHCSPIGPQDQGQVVVPVPLVLAGEDGELGGQGAVKLLHQHVTLGMERCRPRLVHPQPPADLPKDLGLKIPPLVAVELGRDPKTGEHLLHQPLRGGGGTLIRHRICLRPFGEVVHGHEDVAVAGVGDWKRPQDVDPHPFHRCSHQVLLERGMGTLGRPFLRHTGVAAVDMQLNVLSTAWPVEPPRQAMQGLGVPVVPCSHRAMDQLQHLGTKHMGHQQL